MKFTSDFVKFRNAFTLAYLCADRNNLNEALRNVKAVATEDGLTLYSNCITHEMKVTVDKATILDEGEVLLPIDTLYRALLCNTNFNTFDFQTNGSNTSFLNKQYHGVPTGTDNNFLDVKDKEFTAYHEVSSSELRRLIKQTCFVTDKENTKYALSGVLIEFNEEGLTFVSTDGRRMVVCTSKSRNVVGDVVADHKLELTQIVVPSTSLMIVDRIIDILKEDTLIITAKAGQLILRGNSMEMSIKLIQGRFPKWRNINPPCEDWKHAVLKKKELEDSITKVIAVSSVKQSAHKVQYSLLGDTLTLRVMSPTGGTAEIVLGTKEFDGEEEQTNLHAGYALDFLKRAGDYVTMYVNEDCPVVFKSGENYRYILMPMS